MNSNAQNARAPAASDNKSASPDAVGSFLIAPVLRKTGLILRSLAKRGVTKDHFFARRSR